MRRGEGSQIGQFFWDSVGQDAQLSGANPGTSRRRIHTGQRPDHERQCTGMNKVVGNAEVRGT